MVAVPPACRQPPAGRPQAAPSQHTQICTDHCGARELALAPFNLQNEVQTAWLEQAPWEPALLLPSILSNSSSALGKLPLTPFSTLLSSPHPCNVGVLAVWASLQCGRSTFLVVVPPANTRTFGFRQSLQSCATASPVSSLAPVIEVLVTGMSRCCGQAYN